MTVLNAMDHASPASVPIPGSALSVVNLEPFSPRHVNVTLTSSTLLMDDVYRIL